MSEACFSARLLATQGTNAQSSSHSSKTAETNQINRRSQRFDVSNDMSIFLKQNLRTSPGQQMLELDDEQGVTFYSVQHTGASQKLLYI